MAQSPENDRPDEAETTHRDEAPTGPPPAPEEASQPAAPGTGAPSSETPGESPPAIRTDGIDPSGETLPPPASSIDVETETVLPPSPRARLGTLLGRDLRRGATAAILGAGAVALFEYVVSLLLAQGNVRIPTLFRFLALDATLLAVGLLFLAPLTAIAFALPRLLLAATGSDRARTWTGFGASARVVGAPFQPAAPWLWALVLAGLAYAAVSFGMTSLFMKKFKEPSLIAAALAAIQLGLIALLAALAFFISAGLRRAAARLGPRLGNWNPFGRVLAAVLGLVVLGIPILGILVVLLPSLRDVMPWRVVVAGVVYVVACGFGARYLVKSGGLFPRAPVRRRHTLLIAGATALIVIPATLVVWGADPEAKYLAVSASPPLSRLVDLVRFLNDFDRDGYGSLLGENDCAPFNPNIHPNARDIPDNGIDENCNGRDFSTKDLPTYKAGQHMAVPDPYKRDWNILLITIDDTRYDHTGFGGYKKAKGRDTTPNLDQLAARSISFNFANAPSTGTMASIPGIITSKFFHSGIALGPERRPKAPKILPENTLLGEVMKRGGYSTGAILTHEYFVDWGLEQGIDSWDDSLAQKWEPKSISSQDVTAKAEAFIAKQGEKKWFLWCHYLDPHGKYMPHPGEVQFGTTEEDIYDGEIAYTDKYLGKLFDYLGHSPVASRTVIILTSDHGDAFNEHGFINHANTLYRELLHVPLIVFVPEAEPHTVDGPVSGLDVFPTIADLGGIDISDLSIEGESLVPQIFYGRDAKERVVFAETNLPDVQRAVISNRWKLIYHIKANVSELYDLAKDPWEKKNVFSQEKADADHMRGLIDEWLDRVYYARDPSNQAQQVRNEQFLLKSPPKPEHPEGGQVGEVKVIGWDLAKGPVLPGKDVNVTVYLSLASPTLTNYRVEAELFAPAPGPQGGQLSAKQERTPAGDGIFPSSKWHPGEFVKESFKLRVPPASTGTMTLGLRFLDSARKPAATAGGQTQLVLGTIPIDVVAAPAPAK